MKAEKIKSCPFCGSNKLEVMRTNSDACWIACANARCLATACYHPTREGAIRKWNRRSKSTTTETKIMYDMDLEALRHACRIIRPAVRKP